MIYKFPIQNINGGQLANELQIDFENVWCDENTIYINSEEEK